MQLSKHEQKYRVKQQLANKFTQKSRFYWSGQEIEKDVNSIRKLADKMSK